MEVAKRYPNTPNDMISMISHQIQGSPSQNNGTHIGTPVPMNNSPLSNPVPTIHHGLQQRREQGVSGAPQDVLTRSLELIPPAGRAAKMQEAVANIERCVNKLTASVLEEMADIKRPLEDLKSITEVHCEDTMEAKGTINGLLSIVKQQQAQLVSQEKKTDKLEDIIVKIWEKELLRQGSASQYSQRVATPMYTTTAPPLDQTLSNVKRQHSITNSMGGRAPVNAGPGIPQLNILPGQAHTSKHQLIPTGNSLQQATTDVAKQSRPQTSDTGAHSSPTTGNKK